MTTIVVKTASLCAGCQYRIKRQALKVNPEVTCREICNSVVVAKYGENETADEEYVTYMEALDLDEITPEDLEKEKTEKKNYANANLLTRGIFTSTGIVGNHLRTNRGYKLED